MLVLPIIGTKKHCVFQLSIRSFVVRPFSVHYRSINYYFACLNISVLSEVASWRCGRASDLRSRGRGFKSRPGTRHKNLGQVSHTYVPLSPSSISWYWPKGTGWEGKLRAWRKVMAAYHRVHDHACCHLQADCLESRISSGPLRSTMSMGTFTFTFT